MSTLNCTKIQHETGVGDNINLDTSGNVEIAGNLELGGDVEVAGTSDLNGDVDVDGDIVASGDVQMASLNGGQLAGFRNQLINGDFSTWDRGDGSFSAQFAYTTDRWYLALGGGSIQRARDVGLPSGNTIQVDSDATIGQLVELPVMNNGNCSPGPFMPGTTWTFSYYSSNDSLTTAQTNMSFREGSTDDSPTLISDVVTFALTGEEIVGFNRTYYRYSATMTVIDDAEVGDNEGMLVTIPAEDGEWLAMAQLEPGPVATPFEHRPIATELALCQRYFNYFENTFNMNPYKDGDARIFYLEFPTTMRAAPTIEQDNSQYVTNLSMTGYPGVAIFTGDATDSSRGGYVGKVSVDAEL